MFSNASTDVAKPANFNCTVKLLKFRNGRSLQTCKIIIIIIIIMTYKCLHPLAPDYLADMCKKTDRQKAKSSLFIFIAKE